MRRSRRRSVPCVSLSATLPRAFAPPRNSWEDKVMWKDPIVEEVRKQRRQYASRFGFDLDAIFRDLKRKEQQGRRKLVSPPPRRGRTSATGEASRPVARRTA